MNRTTRISVAAIALAFLAGCTATVDGQAQPDSSGEAQDFMFLNQLEEREFPDIPRAKRDELLAVARSSCDDGGVGVSYFLIRDMGWDFPHSGGREFTEVAMGVYCPEQ